MEATTEILTGTELARYISNLQSKGFDQIRFPGGTSKDTKHYSRVIPAFLSENKKKVYFLVLPYDSKSWKKGENNHTKKAGETPLDTAKREFFEETGLTLVDSATEQIRKHSTMYEKDGEVKHTKYDFLTTRVEGSINPFTDGNPIDTETWTPFLMEYSDLKKYLYHGHEESLQTAVYSLSMIGTEWALALLY